MTKQELMKKIVELGGSKPNAKSTKAELEGTLKKLASKPTKRRGSSKDALRTLFKRNGCVTKTDIDQIANNLGVKPNTVETALVDLKNPKWAGGPVINHKKDDEGRYVAA